MSHDLQSCLWEMVMEGGSIDHKQAGNLKILHGYRIGQIWQPCPAKLKVLPVLVLLLLNQSEQNNQQSKYFRDVSSSA